MGQWLAAMVLSAITACATVSVADDAPAIVLQPDAQSAQELQSAVSKALKRGSVPLADDALTHESTLIIEPLRLRDPEGGLAAGRAQGRESRVPELFRLVKNGERCALIHERTGQRIELAHTKCAARR